VWSENLEEERFEGIIRGRSILGSKSLKVSCNVLGLDDFLTFGC
jgi:hypothetical protein